MERFDITFGGKIYKAVEFDGKCVDIDDTIILAEEELGDVILHNYGDELAVAIDNAIFGFAPLELIENGTENELGEYAHNLL